MRSHSGCEQTAISLLHSFATGVLRHARLASVHSSPSIRPHPQVIPDITVGDRGHSEEDAPVEGVDLDELSIPDLTVYSSSQSAAPASEVRFVSDTSIGDRSASSAGGCRSRHATPLSRLPPIRVDQSWRPQPHASEIAAFPPPDGPGGADHPQLVVTLGELRILIYRGYVRISKTPKVAVHSGLDAALYPLAPYSITATETRGPRLS